VTPMRAPLKQSTMASEIVLLGDIGATNAPMALLADGRLGSITVFGTQHGRSASHGRKPNRPLKPVQTRLLTIISSSAHPPLTFQQVETSY
jgi:hypothetical protein